MFVTVKYANRNNTARTASASRQRHLRRVLADYERYYNARRPHQTRNRWPPLHDLDEPIDLMASIKRSTTVAGLIYEYRRAA